MDYLFIQHFIKHSIHKQICSYALFRTLQAKQELSGLSVSVGESVIAQSSKVKDLGVIFDQYLNFDEYISGVYRSAHFHLRNIGRIRASAVL